LQRHLNAGFIAATCPYGRTIRARPWHRGPRGAGGISSAALSAPHPCGWSKCQTVNDIAECTARCVPVCPPRPRRMSWHRSAGGQWAWGGVGWGVHARHTHTCLSKGGAPGVARAVFARTPAETLPCSLRCNVYHPHDSAGAAVTWSTREVRGGTLRWSGGVGGRDLCWRRVGVARIHQDALEVLYAVGRSHAWWMQRVARGESFKPRVFVAWERWGG
jgi:hypothetical protein